MCGSRRAWGTLMEAGGARASVGVSGPRAAPLAVVPLVVTLLSVALQQPVLGLVPVGVVGAAHVPALRRVHVPVCADVAGGGVLVVFLVFFLLLLFILHSHPVTGAPPEAAGHRVAGLVWWHKAVLLQRGMDLFACLLLVGLQALRLMWGCLVLVLEEAGICRKKNRSKRKV